MERFYCVFDSKTEQFAFPFHAKSDVEVVRSIDSDFKRNSESIYVLYPEDFSVWFVGEFNQDSGEFVSVSKVKVADFTDFVKKD